MVEDNNYAIVKQFLLCNKQNSRLSHILTHLASYTFYNLGVIITHDVWIKELKNREVK